MFKGETQAKNAVKWKERKNCKGKCDLSSLMESGGADSLPCGNDQQG